MSTANTAILLVAADYAEACAKVRAIEERINEHAAKGEHKKKNKIINDEWRRACLARNKLERELLESASLFGHMTT